MAQFWTEDPSIGNALAGLADSFSYKNILANQLNIEELKKRRAIAAATQQAIDANQAMWGARQPPTVAPVTTAQQAWATGGGTIGEENVPAGGPKPLQAFTPAIAASDANATSLAQQERNVEFNRVRAKQLADAALGYRHASSMGDVVTNAPKQEAFTQLDLYGVPKTLEGQLQMQTQLTGQLPMLDVKGTTNNYGVVDQQGNVVARGTTRDGRTDLTTGTGIAVPPGHSLVKMGDAPYDQSPFKDKGAELAALEQLNRQSTIGTRPLDMNQMQRAAILLNSQFPQAQKVEKDSAGNIRVVGYNEKVIPPVYRPLVNELNTKLFGQPTVPPAPLPTTSGTPTAGAQTSGPPAVAAAAGPAGAADKPIVPPGSISPTGVTVSPPVVQGAGDEQLKEIINHPVVKGAIDAVRAYNELTAAFRDKSPESDLHGIYMLAKIYDPNSVVREGEVATAANTSPAMEKWWGIYNKQLNAQTALSDRARAAFLTEGYKAAQAHYDAAVPIVKWAGERAQRLDLNPANVMPPIAAPTAPQAPAKAGAAAPAPARGGGGGQTVILDGKRYTKNPDGSFSGPY